MSGIFIGSMAALKPTFVLSAVHVLCFLACKGDLKAEILYFQDYALSHVGPQPSKLEDKLASH